MLGAAGAGPAQAASANLFASVTASGTLAAGNGVSSVTHLGTGQYEVTFSSNVASCAYVATTINAFSQALQVFTAGGHLSTDGVYVETKNQGGGLTDGPFNLAVDCGAPGWSYAVVGYTANLVRATTGTTLTHLGTGRYDVTFPASVGKCAYLATVGDPGNNLVFNPAGVYTGSGPNAHTVYIETKNPGGGLADGIPFHLAVICPTAANTRIAVVNATGIPARGSALTSTFSASHRELHAGHQPGPVRLRGDRHPRLGQHQRAVRPRHRRDHPRSRRQHHRHPGPRPAVLRRQPGSRILPRRHDLLTQQSGPSHAPATQRGRGATSLPAEREAPPSPPLRRTAELIILCARPARDSLSPDSA